MAEKQTNKERLKDIADSIETLKCSIDAVCHSL